MDSVFVLLIGIVGFILSLVWWIWFTGKIADIARASKETSERCRIAAEQATIQTNILAQMAKVDANRMYELQYPEAAAMLRKTGVVPPQIPMS